MRVDVKPLIHWAIYKQYTVRFTSRSTQEASGWLTTPEGAVAFRYDSTRRVIKLPDREVALNDYGWEVES